MKKIINNLKNSKIYKVIHKARLIDQKYGLSIISAAVSFYMITAVISVFIIGVQIFNYPSGELNDFLISKILLIFSDTILSTIKNSLPAFTLNEFSFLVFINIVWSASAIINAYNKVCDSIYEEIPRRNAYRNRISAFLMFTMIIFIIIFEMLILIFSKHFFIYVLGINSYILMRIMLFMIEILIIYIIIVILYIYAPPRKTKLSEVYFGSLIATLIVYFLLQLFILLVKTYGYYNHGYAFLTVLTFSFFFLFIINYVIILGLKFCYEIWKKVQD